MNTLVSIFSALADETRLSFVERLLSDGELPAGVLATQANISGPAVSRHLKVLREAGVVRQRVAGTHRYYSISPEAMETVSAWTIERRSFWERGLDRLEALVQSDKQRKSNG